MSGPITQHASVRRLKGTIFKDEQLTDVTAFAIALMGLSGIGNKVTPIYAQWVLQHIEEITAGEDYSPIEKHEIINPSELSQAA